MRSQRTLRSLPNHIYLRHRKNRVVDSRDCRSIHNFKGEASIRYAKEVEGSSYETAEVHYL